MIFDYLWSPMIEVLTAVYTASRHDISHPQNYPNNSIVIRIINKSGIRSSIIYTELLNK